MRNCSIIPRNKFSCKFCYKNLLQGILCICNIKIKTVCVGDAFMMGLTYSEVTNKSSTVAKTSQIYSCWFCCCISYQVIYFCWNLRTQAGDGKPVETAGGLVQEEHSRTSENLQPDTDAPSLSAAEATKVPVANGRVGAVLETHLHNGALHNGIHRRPGQGAWKPHVGREIHRFADGECSYQVIGLCHISLHEMPIPTPHQRQMKESWAWNI